MQWSFWFAGLINTGPDDRMYDCLPMYHSIGGVVATGAALVNGGSVVLRDKFSVQNFWNDICEWDCTLFQYIGELCRYLVNAPEHPRERAHRLRLCCGNGLRADVWESIPDAVPHSPDLGILRRDRRQLLAVQRRGQGRRHRPPAFVPHPSLPAGAGAIRSCGRRAGARRRWLLHPLRNGRARRGDRPHRCHLGAGGAFEGYTNDKESERKILRNVFEKGDAWYRTGDLMRRDARGFFYFVDRIGDTFRWKGENVATSEVAAAIVAFPGIIEATVYGVAVPGTEGAAGMAALVVDGAFDFSQLRKHLARVLPSYARPLFLRIRTAST